MLMSCANFTNVFRGMMMMMMMIIIIIMTDERRLLTDERRLALFPAGTIVRDPYHGDSPTRGEQGLSLRRTRV